MLRLIAGKTAQTFVAAFEAKAESDDSTNENEPGYNCADRCEQIDLPSSEPGGSGIPPGNEPGEQGVLVSAGVSEDIPSFPEGSRVRIHSLVCMVDRMPTRPCGTRTIRYVIAQCIVFQSLFVFVP